MLFRSEECARLLHAPLLDVPLSAASPLPLLSIYIPHIRSYHSEQNVAQVMQELGIGKVCRVDFITRHQHELSFSSKLRPTDDGIVDCFVYFSSIEPHQYENTGFWGQITRAADKAKETDSPPDPVVLYVNGQREYWLCFKNLEPIPFTNLNPHQMEIGRAHV